MKRYNRITGIVIILALCFITLPFDIFSNSVYGATKSQNYTEAELQRAVSLGIGSYSKNVQITHEQFFKMLDHVVKLSNPQKLATWQSQYKKARYGESRSRHASHKS